MFFKYYMYIVCISIHVYSMFKYVYTCTLYVYTRMPASFIEANVYIYGYIISLPVLINTCSEILSRT